MIRRFIAAACAALILAGPALALPPSTSDGVARSVAQAAAVAAARPTSLRYVGKNHLPGNVSGNAGTDYSVSARLSYANKGALSRIAVCTGNLFGFGSGTELGTAGPEIERYTIEANSQTYQLSKNGVVDLLKPASTAAGAPYNCTDVAGVPIAPNSSWWVRMFRRTAKPPQSPAASLQTGGVLSTASTWFYKVTTVDNGIESGGSTEVSVTPTSNNQAALLTWSAPSYGQTVNIYRSTATGTEQFLTSLSASQTSYVDLGYLTTNSALTVPAQTPVRFDRYPISGESTNPSYSAGGTGPDLTTTTGVISARVGPTNAYAPKPMLVIGDESAPAIEGLGDSIQGGVGLTTSGSSGPYQGNFSNWFDLGTPAGSFGTLNYSIGGTSLAGLLRGSNLARARLSLSVYADYVVSDLGHNDLAISSCAQIAADHLQLAKSFTLQGKRYVPTTLTPYVTATTDGFTSVAGQTLSAYESVRTCVNNWVRAGSPVGGSGVAVTSGSGGTKSPYVYAYYDLAAAVGEVNSAGVATNNGGYWPAPGVFATGVLSGTPTTTSLPCATCSFTAASGTSAGVQTMILRMTSGAASGQFCFITNNTATSLTCVANGVVPGGVLSYGLTTTPAAGDSFSVYAIPSPDGTHLSFAGNATAGASFGTWASAKLTGFAPLK